MPAKKPAAPAKPTYAIMVTESIKTLGDRTGSSVQAISKQLQSQYSIDINKPALLKAIKKGVEQGDFVQIKASYKLAKKQVVPVKKPPAPKKPTKAPVKKTRTVQSKTSTKPTKTIIKKSLKKSVTKSTKKSARKTATKKGATKKKSTKK